MVELTESGSRSYLLSAGACKVRCIIGFSGTGLEQIEANTICCSNGCLGTCARVEMLLYVGGIRSIRKKSANQ